MVSSDALYSSIKIYECAMPTTVKSRQISKDAMSQGKANKTKQAPKAIFKPARVAAHVDQSWLSAFRILASLRLIQ